ncbi:MAG: nickel pincer cofactor biosynthesis protein LarB [Thermoplasmata archaeon]|nr:nickel pincer cofactor biosynthesis protein LarB [Thermoplasmata archaeon]
MRSPARPARGPGRRVLAVANVGRLDVDRAWRTGAPEVILGEGKRPEHLLALLKALHRTGRGALISRLTPAQARALRAGNRRREFTVRFLAGGRVARLAGEFPRPVRDGRVALVTAGTSDIPFAEEARAVLEACGVRVDRAYDVGVAGVHRLQRAVARLERRRPRVYLAFAGREGALPTVLAGLVRAPVVGVPTSVGYGRGGRGEAALGAMLQSCAPIAVVNIDAAVPAALFAVQLLVATPGSATGPV